MKAMTVFLYRSLISILFAATALFLGQIEAKEWAPVQKDPSPYFFVDTENKKWLLIQGVRSKDGSFQDGMSVYRSTDGKNFFPLVAEGFRTEEALLGGNPIKRKWVVLKDPTNGVKYELFHSKMQWEREPRQSYEVIFLMSESFGEYDEGIREYTRTFLPCEEIRVLRIHADK